MSILLSLARPNGAFRQFREVWLRDQALLAARCGPIVHRATKPFFILPSSIIDHETLPLRRASQTIILELRIERSLLWFAKQCLDGTWFGIVNQK